MKRAQRSRVGSYLPWVLVQGSLFLPVALGATEEFPLPQWLGILIEAVVVGSVVLGLAVNLALMWRAPDTEADRGGVARLAAVGAWFALLALGKLLDVAGDRLPLGGCWLVLAVAVWVVAARDLVRIGRRRSGRRPARDGVAA